MMDTDLGGISGSREPSPSVSALTGFDPGRIAELAERCEAQDGAEWAEIAELFEDVFREVFPRPDRIWITDNTGDWTSEYTRWQANQSSFYELLEAQAFLDAALLLVPEGFRLERLADTTPTIQPWQKGPWVAQLTTDDWPRPRRYGSSEHGSSPALALCAAALRARAASGTPTRRAETLGSVGEADGGQVPQGDAQNDPR